MYGLHSRAASNQERLMMARVCNLLGYQLVLIDPCFSSNGKSRSFFARFVRSYFMNSKEPLYFELLVSNYLLRQIDNYHIN